MVSHPVTEEGCPLARAHEAVAAGTPAAPAEGVNTAAAAAHASRKEIGLLFNRKFHPCFGLPLVRPLAAFGVFMAASGRR